MTEESKIAFKSTKIANIIFNLKEMFNFSLREATDMFYTSEIALMIEEGVADLHCRSDKYLATLIMEEYPENKRNCTMD